MIANIRKRARSFSSSSKEKDRVERSASTPNTAETHSSPPTPPPGRSPHNPSVNAPGIVQSSSTASTVIGHGRDADTPPLPVAAFPTADFRGQSHSRGRSRSPQSPSSRSRSRPRHNDQSPPPLDDLGLFDVGEAPEPGESRGIKVSLSNWWERTNDGETTHRPWRDALSDALHMSPPLGQHKDLPGLPKDKPFPDRKATLSSLAAPDASQEEGYVLTRKRVATAARVVLGTALDITHEGLLISADLLELAPVPGLQVAARTLLGIWDALQRVDVSMNEAMFTPRC